MWGLLSSLGRVFRRYPTAATIGCLVLTGLVAVLVAVALVLQAFE